MRRLLAAAAVTAVLATACGGGGSGSGDDHAGHDQQPTATASPSRTVQVTAKDFSFDGVDAAAPEAGDAIEFVMKNAGAAEHELRFWTPGDKGVGGVGHVEPGGTGRAVVVFAEAGSYRYACTIGGHDSLGMKGVLTVG